MFPWKRVEYPGCWVAAKMVCGDFLAVGSLGGYMTGRNRARIPLLEHVERMLSNRIDGMQVALDQLRNEIASRKAELASPKKYGWAVVRDRGEGAPTSGRGVPMLKVRKRDV